MFKNIFKKLGQIVWKKKESTTQSQITKPKGVISRLKSWFKPKTARAELPKPTKVERPKIPRPDTQIEKKIIQAIKNQEPKIQTGGTFLPPSIKEPKSISKAQLIEDFIGIELEVQERIVERNKQPGYGELLELSEHKLNILKDEKRRLEGMTVEEIKEYIAQKKKDEKDLEDKLKKVRIQERDRKGWDPDDEEWTGYSV